MPEIALLTQDTIDKIAAGEVIERPASVVKELVENAIDAGSSAVTVEIKDGGISFIRITDNGCGIDREQLPLAFLRHSTSKIRNVEDLLSIHSLGFRGEALSSIAAISRVEVFTKTINASLGTRYVIEGSREKAYEETGAPDGTTFLIKDLFYNTPARRKFLKSPQTEGNYISDMMEKMSLSHPSVSFKYIQNNTTKLHSSGNGNQKDVIYHVFGRDITANLLEVDYQCELFSVKGYIGKPIVTRGNRNLEIYFINGRYVKSNVISKAIEEAYKPYIMQHQYPFTVLYFDFPGDHLDVNVHPTKMELRFDHSQEVFTEIVKSLGEILGGRELIQEVSVSNERETKNKSIFEERMLHDLRQAVKADSPYEKQYVSSPINSIKKEEKTKAVVSEEIHYDDRNTFNPKVAHITDSNRKVNVPILSAFKKEDAPKPPEFQPQSVKAVISPITDSVTEAKDKSEAMPSVSTKYEDMKLSDLDPVFLAQESKTNHKIIGQLFETYWLVEMGDKLFIIDQHAAHEKVLFERFMKQLQKKEFTSQQLNPPIVMTLDDMESSALEKYRNEIERFGYAVEPFGGKEYLINAIPDNLYKLDMKDLFVEMLDDFANENANTTPQIILEKVATMSCKAAVKGNNKLSLAEVNELIDELLTLDNPYNCPHGRPTIISMSKYEIEKKFKRII